jgi:hypothetical protein
MIPEIAAPDESACKCVGRLGSKCLRTRAVVNEVLSLSNASWASWVHRNLLTFSKEIGERQYDARVRLYEASVKISEAEEYLKIVLRLGNGPIDNGFDAIWIHCDAIGEIIKPRKRVSWTWNSHFSSLT